MGKKKGTQMGAKMNQFPVYYFNYSHISLVLYHILLRIKLISLNYQYLLH
jgi:hypothetical protein